ncbi:MAG TPA: virulence factor [Methylomirabilota bacterium]|nr:virulence factor [Methylomirabilota bacterium]
MATYQIIAWRGIPASVESRDGVESVTRQLSERFHMLIDSAAMQLGLDESEAYIEQWARSAPVERPGNAAEVADGVVAELEQRFPEFIGQAFRRP